MAFNLLTFPNYLAAQLNVSTFVAGLILSFLFLLAIAASAQVAVKNDKITIIAAFGSILVSAGMGWTPSWVVILITMVLVALWSNVLGKVMG